MALPATDHRLDPQIFLGWAGSGKTLLAKILAKELQNRAERVGLPRPVLLEVFPADIDNVAALDEALLRALQYESAVIFIDEVHCLTGTHSHKLYELLENHRYKFQGEDFPVELPNVTLLAATTDYGQLHPALQRRWIKHYFEPATASQLLQFLERRARARHPADLQALKMIVDHTHVSGQPWEAVEMFGLAEVRARARGNPRITVEDVHWVLTNQGIDSLGLRRIDRQVIDALLTRKRTMRGGEVVYGASESDTCMLARIDKAEYRETIRPKLMTRGLLQMRAGVGQALTDKAVKLYGG